MGNLNARSAAFGFIAGALAVLVFHQGMVLILHLMKVVPNPPWNFAAMKGPLPVPTLLNQMFWGGLWGIGFVLVAGMIPIAHNILRGVVYGLVGPFVLGNAVLVPFFKGGPYFWGWQPPRMIAGALIGAAFGAGIAVFVKLLNRR